MNKEEQAKCKLARSLLSAEGTFAIESMEVIDTFEDDHVLCGVVRINACKLGFWWCGWEILAAVKYQDRPTVVEFFQERVDLDESDDEILEMFNLPR